MKLLIWWPLLPLALAPGTALGLDIVPASWSVTTADARYRFVMVSPMTAEEDLKAHWEKAKKDAYFESRRQYSDTNAMAYMETISTREEVAAWRALYRVSGLYHNDGSSNLVWALQDERYLLRSVVLSSDGRHLVYFQDIGSMVSEPVLTFYAEGKPIRSYTRGNLVTFPFLLRWKPGPTRPWRASYSLDEHQGRLTVRTKLGDRFVFDVATGKRVSAMRFSLVLAAVFGALIVSVVRILFTAVRSRLQKSEPTHRTADS